MDDNFLVSGFREARKKYLGSSFDDHPLGTWMFCSGAHHGNALDG